MTSPTDGSQSARRRKLFQIADELGLGRDDRIEIARFVLWRDINSWKHLTDEQVGRLLDAFEGYIAVKYLKTREVGASRLDTAVPPGR